MAGHIASWRGSCECYPLSAAAAVSGWLLLLLSPLLSLFPMFREHLQVFVFLRFRLGCGCVGYWRYFRCRLGRVPLEVVKDLVLYFISCVGRFGKLVGPVAAWAECVPPRTGTLASRLLGMILSLGPRLWRPWSSSYRHFEIFAFTLQGMARAGPDRLPPDPWFLTGVSAESPG